MTAQISQFQRTLHFSQLFCANLTLCFQSTTSVRRARTNAPRTPSAPTRTATTRAAADAASVATDSPARVSAPRHTFASSQRAATFAQCDLKFLPALFRLEAECCCSGVFGAVQERRRVRRPRHVSVQEGLSGKVLSVRLVLTVSLRVDRIIIKMQGLSDPLVFRALAPFPRLQAQHLSLVNGELVPVEAEDTL